MTYSYTTAMINLPLVREATADRAHTPQDIERVCADMKSLAQECFQVLTTNSKNGIRGHYRHAEQSEKAGKTIRHAVDLFVVDEGDAAMALCANVYEPDEEPTRTPARDTEKGTTVFCAA